MTIGYKFVWNYDNNEKIITIDNSRMEIIFNKLPILKYLIHGHENFRIDDLTVVGEFIIVKILENYIDDYKDFLNLINELLELSEVTKRSVETSLILGGSSFLENEFIKKNDFEKMIAKKNIIRPENDFEKIYEWKQVIACNSLEFKNCIERLTNLGFTAINPYPNNYSHRDTFAFPFILIFRKEIDKIENKT